MNEIIQDIIKAELSLSAPSIEPITGLGSVNDIYLIQEDEQEFILRINEEPGKLLEFKKEAWCLHELADLGIPSPKLIRMSSYEDKPFMILNKLPGVNGKTVPESQQASIWKRLGSYAAQFHQITDIEEEEVKQAAFHKHWKDRLYYNIQELHEDDSLLSEQVLSQQEHQQAKDALGKLTNKDLPMGLVHGDLCPRNTLLDKDTLYLLDWGTAEIDVVPHMEIGRVMMSGEASPTQFQLFLQGLGISQEEFQQIHEEILLLKLLHCLDVYRWAEGRGLTNINDYKGKVQRSLAELSQ